MKAPDNCLQAMPTAKEPSETSSCCLPRCTAHHTGNLREPLTVERDYQSHHAGSFCERLTVERDYQPHHAGKLCEPFTVKSGYQSPSAPHLKSNLLCMPNLARACLQNCFRQPVHLDCAAAHWQTFCVGTGAYRMVRLRAMPALIRVEQTR